MQHIEHSNAQSGRWVANITGLESVEYKLTEPAIPSINAGTTELGGRDDVVLFVPGDRISFDEIQLSFIVDKTYRNYYHCYKWIRDNVNRNEPILRDVTITLLDNQSQPQGVSITYKDCFPINVSPPLLDNSGATTDIVISMTLKVVDMEMNHPDDPIL